MQKHTHVPIILISGKKTTTTMKTRTHTFTLQLTLTMEGIYVICHVSIPAGGTLSIVSSPISW